MGAGEQVTIRQQEAQGLGQRSELAIRVHFLSEGEEIRVSLPPL